MIEAGDADLVRGIFLDTYVDSASSFGDTLESVQARPSDYWTEFSLRLAKGVDAVGFVSLDPEGRAVGFVFADTKIWVLEIPPRSAVIRHLWVKRTLRRHGIGHALMSRVTDWALRANLESLVLGVLESNSQAVGFFQNMGFSIVGHRTPWPSEPERRAVVLSRLVSQAESSARPFGDTYNR